MPDTVVNVTSTAAPGTEAKVAVAPLLTDAEQTAKTILQVYNTHGAQGIAALLPVLSQDAKDVEAALPIIKAGYKTTEFWLVIAGMLVTAVVGVEGKDTAFQSIEALVALAGSYAVSRGVAKKGNS